MTQMTLEEIAKMLADEERLHRKVIEHIRDRCPHNPLHMEYVSGDGIIYDQRVCQVCGKIISATARSFGVGSQALYSGSILPVNWKPPVGAAVE